MVHTWGAVIQRIDLDTNGVLRMTETVPSSNIASACIPIQT